MRRLTEALGANPIEQQKLASFSQMNKAGKWYDRNWSREQKQVLTWEVFSDAFERQFISETVKGLRGQEFLNLHQGDMSVSEFEDKFLEMANFASHMTLSNFAMARLFENKLNPKYKRMEASSCFPTFREVVDSARVCEMSVLEDTRAR